MSGPALEPIAVRYQFRVRVPPGLPVPHACLQVSIPELAAQRVAPNGEDYARLKAVRVLEAQGFLLPGEVTTGELELEEMEEIYE